MSKDKYKCFFVQYLRNREYSGYLFAETRGKAMYECLLALKEVGFYRAEFLDVKARREKDLDRYFIEPHKVFDYNQVLSGGK